MQLDAVAQWLERRTGDRGVICLNPGRAASEVWQFRLPPHCLCRTSDERLKVVGPFYLVSMPGEVKLKDPTQIHTCVTCRQCLMQRPVHPSYGRVKKTVDGWVICLFKFLCIMVSST